MTMNETTTSAADTAQKNAHENPKPDTPDKEHESWGSFVWFLIKLVLAVLIFRAFIFASFNIPSESMLPRLMVGDHLFAAKWPYGFTNNSLPFKVPLIPGRILASDPVPGDVAVFAHPIDGTEYIKRVIGLPGDTIQVVDGHLHINGKPIQREQIADFVQPTTPTGHCRTVALTQRLEDGSFACVYPQFKETLPNGISYNTLDFTDGPQDHTAAVVVPEGHLFMMGDNRDNSLDSRFPAEKDAGVGLVPMDNLIARASMIFFSSGDDGIRWGRFGDGL